MSQTTVLYRIMRPSIALLFMLTIAAPQVVECGIVDDILNALARLWLAIYSHYKVGFPMSVS